MSAEGNSNKNIHSSSNPLNADDTTETCGGTPTSPPIASIEDAVYFIKKGLAEKVSGNIRTDMPDTKNSGNQTIDSMNAHAITSLTNILNNIEGERLKQQKPLRNWLLVFMGLQLLFFNLVIGYVLIKFSQENGASAAETFDFLKFYMGGSLAELLAMIFFITRNTFASTGQDIVKGLINRISKN